MSATDLPMPSARVMNRLSLESREAAAATAGPDRPSRSSTSPSRSQPVERPVNSRMAAGDEDTETSGDGVNTSSSDGEDEADPSGQPDFRGNLKTRLCWNAK